MIMAKRIYRETRQLVTEDGHSYKLSYFLTQKQSEITEQPIYGVAVTKELGGIIEEEEIDNLSYIQTDIEAMLLKLANNLVTPLCLIEIVDGIITERINQ